MFWETEGGIARIIAQSNAKLSAIRVGAVVFLVLFTACADRERLNPLDPLNPQTKGRPTGVEVISKKDRVILSWDRIEVQGLVGYNIYRKSAQDSSFSKTGFCASTVTVFEDTDVRYDLEYGYQVSAVTSNYESFPSAPVFITPGPTYYWVADTYNGQIVKLTHDARHVIFRSSMIGYPYSIASYPGDGSAWVADVLSEEVIKISADGDFVQWVYGFSQPVDVAVDPADGSVWVADDWSGSITKLNSFGNRDFDVSFFPQPTSLSVDRRDRGCWLVERGRKVANILPYQSAMELSIPFVSPQAVAVTTDGSLWVADSSAVHKLLPPYQRIALSVPSFYFAYRVAVGEKTGSCWVLDIGGSGRLVKLSSQGEIEFELSGFSGARSLTVSPYDEGCLICDTGNDRVVKVSAEGEVVAETGGFYRPFDGDVEYQPFPVSKRQ